MALSDDQKAKLDYFQKHGMPILLEHMKFRAVGLQIFVATQAFLFTAWGVGRTNAMAWLGLATCVSLLVWDQRNRYIIGLMHRLGRSIGDSLFFELDDKGQPKDGVHHQLTLTLVSSGKLLPFTRLGLVSHTTSYRLILLVASLIWLLVLWGVVQPPPVRVA